MREIKFRAWDTEENEMIYPDTESKVWDYFQITLKGEICLYDTDDYGKTGLWEHNICFKEDRFILMQFTGLKDKKRTEEYPEGQEIYEGDILNPGLRELRFGEYATEIEQQGTGFTTFSHKAQPPWNIPFTFASRQAEGSEIIGNIHQDSELVEGKKDD